MKYEMIFGDPQLFNHAPEDAVLVSVQLSDFRYFTEGNLQSCTKFNIYKFQTCDTQLAMRRVIQEPKRWTIEDQMAGLLPEVGAECENAYTHKNMVVLFKDEKVIIALNTIDSLATNFTHKQFIECNKPLETAEEKAERLRCEWVELVRDKTLLSADEYTTEAIYDALLSGTLSVPTKAGE